jgi:hypothetical protein
MNLSPAVEWKDNFNVTTDMAGDVIDPVDPDYLDLVDDDWFFDVTEVEVGGVAAGYAAVGYVGDRKFRELTFEDENGDPIECFQNERPIVASGFSCGDFETSTRQKGFHRQLMVLYDLNGKVTKFIRYNQGDLFGVYQDGNHLYLIGDGSNALTLTDAVPVGLTWNEPQLNNIPIYYNPTTLSQEEFDLENYSADCTANPELKWQRKLNIIKVNLQGDVIWNNYYGFQDILDDAVPMRGIGKSLVVKNGTIIAGGQAQLYETYNGITEKANNQILLSVDKNTGYLNWKLELDSNADGEVFEINYVNNDFVIAGHKQINNANLFPGTDTKDGFLVATNSPALSIADFANPLLYRETSDFALDIPEIDVTRNSASSSAIIHNNHIY